MEFHGRGAAHIHGTLWLDIKNIEKSSPFSEDSEERTEEYSVLSEAFRKFRDDVPLSEKEKNAIVKLTDMFITCSLDPNFGNEKVVKIAKSVNCHYCTRTCQKYGGICRFDFPKLPLKNTIDVDKNDEIVYILRKENRSRLQVKSC